MHKCIWQHDIKPETLWGSSYEVMRDTSLPQHSVDGTLMLMTPTWYKSRNFVGSSTLMSRPHCVVGGTCPHHLGFDDADTRCSSCATEFLFMHDAYMHSASLLSKDGWLDGCHMPVLCLKCKWPKVSSNFFLGLVALPLWFSNTALWLQSSNGKGSLFLRWNFQSHNAEQWQCCTTLWPTAPK